MSICLLLVFKVVSFRGRSPWWRHQMETFPALPVLCTGNSPVTSEFPSQRPVTPRFDVSLHQRLNKRLNKQSWGWWFQNSIMTGPTDILTLNTLRPRLNGRHFAGDHFKHIFFIATVRIAITIARKFVPISVVNNIASMAQILTWHRPGNKPLSEQMIVRLPTHICVTRSQC